MKRTLSAILLGGILLAARPAQATPSTTYWAPSTTYVQPYLVPHVTYDTYFAKGPLPGFGAASGTSPLYPITTGLTVGVLPWEKLQLELGFDLMLPNPDPFFLNAKLGTPESTFFDGSPSLAVGAFGFGTKGDVTNYNIVYGQAQKNLPWGGYVSAGAYYGAGSKLLWTGSDGGENRWGFMGAVSAPDININIPGLKKIIPVADVMTGKNAFGAVGGGIYFYFTDTIDLLTGPVFFLDKALQPGGRDFLWTVQLDIDVTLFAPKPAPVPQSPKT